MNQIKSYNLLFSLLIFQFITLIAQPISSFSLQSFNSDTNPNFNSNFALLGDAQITNDGNFINFSSGQIVYKKPLNFLDAKTFSSEFSFSITPGDGDGIVFIIFPNNLDFSKVFDQGYFGLSSNINNKFLIVEYNTKNNDNHIGINIGSFVSNVVSGVKLTSWINYDANLLKLEIRLAKFGSKRPKTPLINYSIDLSKMWGINDVLIGISSYQRSRLYSWNFEMKSIQKPYVEMKKSCLLSVLGGVIFATGCGTLVAFVGLFTWVIFFGRQHSNNVVLDLGMMNHVDFKYEKVDVLVDNDTKKLLH